MANTTNNVNKTDGSPESTWGASKKAKETWDHVHGPAARRTAATREGAPAAKEEDEK